RVRVLSNTVEACGSGMFLYDSSYASAIGNLVNNTNYGIDTLSTDKALFTDNPVANSPAMALRMRGNNDAIYHNNFFLRDGQMLDWGPNNAYDNGYPSGGNYWSNGTHADDHKGAQQNIAGQDGINDVAQT